MREVVGELGQVRVEIVDVDGLQRLPDLLVEHFVGFHATAVPTAMRSDDAARLLTTGVAGGVRANPLLLRGGRLETQPR